MKWIYNFMSNGLTSELKNITLQKGSRSHKLAKWATVRGQHAEQLLDIKDIYSSQGNE